MKEEAKWFNCDGNLKLIDNPQLNLSYKPQEAEVIETNYVLPDQNGCIKETPDIFVCKSNILLLNITQLKFNHHPLFSLEHIFHKKLLFYYEKFHERKISNKLEVIMNRLESLRRSRDAMNINGSGENVAQHVEEIKKLRNKLILESSELRGLTKNILRNWKNIKMIRKKKGYSNTNVSLIIYKEKSNYSVDIEQQRREIENMITEIANEMKFDYQNKLDEYRDDLAKWKLNKSEDKKPKKPIIDIDEDDIRHEVLATFKEAFRPPGEPILTFKITNNNLITNEIEDKNENLRRQALKATKLYFKIIYNNTEAFKSKSIDLNDEFLCNFEEAFSLKVNDFPDRVIMELYEIPGSLSKRKIAEICLKLPHLKNRYQQENIDEFLKEELIHYKHEGTGSGIELEEVTKDLELNLDENYLLNTCGSINYHINWDESKISEIKEDNFTHSNVLDEKGEIDSKKLSDWVKNVKIDPLNPHNSFIFEYLESGLNDVCETPKSQFRCNPEMKKLSFYSPEKINSNLRFQVLQLRNKNEPEFLGMYVPNRLKEIPENILTNHNQRKKQERTLSADSEDDNVDAKRLHGIRCLKQLHTKVYQQCRSSQNNLTYENIVDERLISYFQNLTKTLLFNFLNWFKIRPGMNKPLPKLAIEQRGEGEITPLCKQSSSKIIVEVLSATNIPHKVLVKKQSRTRSSSEILEEPKVYIEVTYEGMTLGTSVQEGINPNWNQKLMFPLRSKHIDYLNPNALNGVVVINIWNETELKGSDSKSNDWLGNIRIPIASIAHTEKLSGFFKVNSPLLLNYEHHIIHIQLNIWMEPNFPKFILDLETISTSEPAYLHKHIFNWNKIYNASYPHRQFSSMVIDYYGKTICLTRFIKPLEPPQTNVLGHFETTPEQCARFVQLIPFIECNKLYNNVCLCVEEMLKLSIGTILDHAITLTCYIIALNIDAWLLLGHGVPNGQTAYVLIRENNINQIFDVTTGNKYDIIDPFCPLQRVFCVINEENIWANTQRTNDLNLTQFDFNKRSDWSPLFNNQVSAPTNSIQKKIIYTQNNVAEELEVQLESKLKKKIMKYRKTARTIWNHTLSNYFKQHMESLEDNTMYSKHDISHLRNTDYTQQVHGFIINLPYCNSTILFEKIKSSKVFNVDTPSKDFVIALHLHEYPNEILAVWILIGFVLPR
nr:coiled-coil and C2 domain-containing protein 2A [Onthophagus taurus]